MSITACLVLSKMMLAGWALFSAAEWLSNLSLLRSDGLLAWELLRLRPSVIGPCALRTAFYSGRAITAVLLARLCAALVLLWPAVDAADLPASLIVLFSCFYVARRTRFGGDGADQMGMVVAIGVVLMSAGLTLKDPPLAWCGVFAIAGQAALAYPAAGIAKLVSPLWRAGTALPAIMNTQSYGHQGAAQLASSRPVFSRSLCWLIILAESLFPVIFLLPPALVIASLACFAAFHWANAYFMGLNAFVWSFLATYPSVFAASQAVRHLLGWP